MRPAIHHAVTNAGNGCAARKRAAAGALAAACLVALGCACNSGRAPATDAARSAAVPGEALAVCLAAAGTDSPPPGPRPPSRIEHAFGVEAGLVLPFGEMRLDYLAAPAAGVGVMFWSTGRQVPWELGARCFRLEGDGADVSADLVVVRADLVLPMPAADEMAWLCSLGIRLLLSDSRTYWGGTYEAVAGLGGSVELARVRRGASVGLSLDFPLGSGNIQGLAAVHGGWTF